MITSQNISVHNSGRWKTMTLTRLTFRLIFYWNIYILQQQWPHEQRVVCLCYGMPHLFESWIVLSTWNITVQGISVREPKCVIQWTGIALSTFRTTGARLKMIRINDLDACLSGPLSNNDVYLVLSTVFLAGPFQISSTLEASLLGAEPQGTSIYNRKKREWCKFLNQ